MSEKLPHGSIGWIDLTVPDAALVRDFYHAVTGWTAKEVKMAGYSDYCMNQPGTGQMVAGICHARGENANLPSQWLIYITVPDVDAAAVRCRQQGGKVLCEPKDMGHQGRFCVIQDPAGAVAALYTPKS